MSRNGLSLTLFRPPRSCSGPEAGRGSVGVKCLRCSLQPATLHANVTCRPRHLSEDTSFRVNGETLHCFDEPRTLQHFSDPTHRKASVQFVISHRGHPRRTLHSELTGYQLSMPRTLQHFSDPTHPTDRRAVQ